MSGWYSKNLGDALLADAQLEELTSLFLAAYARADRPAEMAVFIRHESEGRLHCEVIAYFSPAAERVAKSVGAKPCRQPSPDSLGFLAGAEDAWSLFAER